MPELQARRRIWLPAGVGVALAVVAGAGGVIALVAGGLAQPAFALAVRGTRQRRKRIRLRRDALSLSLLWGAGLLLAALLVAWPVLALVDTPTLAHVLVASAAVGLLLIALWRTWPLWQSAERDGGRLSEHWRALAAQQALTELVRFWRTIQTRSFPCSLLRAAFTIV